jgi:hypothetical protein
MNRDVAGAVARRIGIAFVVLFVGLGSLAYVFGWFTEGAQVVQEQFGATASLKKYEMFKEWSAQLDAKAATLKSYENRLKELENSYAGRRRAEWTREDREQYNLWQQYIAGIQASYNTLAAEYNAPGHKPMRVARTAAPLWQWSRDSECVSPSQGQSRFARALRDVVTTFHPRSR